MSNAQKKSDIIITAGESAINFKINYDILTNKQPMSPQEISKSFISKSFLEHLNEQHSKLSVIFKLLAKRPNSLSLSLENFRKEFCVNCPYCHKYNLGGFNNYFTKNCRILSNPLGISILCPDDRIR